MDLVASEQSEERSDAESQPGRTRDAVGELVEAVPLCREGGAEPGTGWLSGRGTGGVTSFTNTSGVGSCLSVCLSVSLTVGQ